MPLHMEQRSVALCKITNLVSDRDTDMFAYFQWCVTLSNTLNMKDKFNLQYNGQVMPLVI